MSIALAEAIVRIASVYFAIGLLFGIPFVARLVRKLDPLAAEGSLGFRLLILPGTIALWPLLLTRLLRGAPEPRERSPHRAAATRRSNP